MIRYLDQLYVKSLERNEKDVKLAIKKNVFFSRY